MRTSSLVVRFALAASLLLAALGCSPGVLTAALEDKLVYHPSGPPKKDTSPTDLVKEDVWFQAPDGVKLHGWYCPVENPRGVVLFAHGNAGTVADRATKLRLLTKRLGVTVLAFEYRGYGHSEGKPSEPGLLADARAARRYLAQRTGVAEREIVLYGQSLGGAVMVDLAAGDGAAGLVLESTFTSLADVANYKYPLTPPGKLLVNCFDSISKIGRFNGPLVVAHGARDRIVPITQAKELFAAAGEPKWFVGIPDGGHDWTPTLEFISAVENVLNIAAAGESPAPITPAPTAATTSMASTPPAIDPATALQDASAPAPTPDRASRPRSKDSPNRPVAVNSVAM
jgi:fermentation-respiration switch protein FrsA (DUF1100 family)